MVWSSPLLFFVLLVVYLSLFVGAVLKLVRRPSEAAERAWLRDLDLPEESELVDLAVRRQRGVVRWRRAGAVTGFLLAVVLVATQRPAAVLMDPLFFTVAGLLTGGILGELAVRAPAAGPQRDAQLVPRTLGTWLSVPSRAALWVAGAGLFTFSAASVGHHPAVPVLLTCHSSRGGSTFDATWPSSAWLATTAALAVVVSVGLELAARRVVLRRPLASQDPMLGCDLALRARSLSSVFALGTSVLLWILVYTAGQEVSWVVMPGVCGRSGNAFVAEAATTTAGILALVYLRRGARPRTQAIDHRPVTVT